MVNESKSRELFGFPKRDPEGALDQCYCNLALAIQWVTEEIVLKFAKEAKRLTGADYLCVAGGVALNGVAIGKLDEEGLFKKIYVQPAAGDAGGSVGAAYAGYHIYFDQERLSNDPDEDPLNGAYLGPAYSDADVEKIFRKYGVIARQFNDEGELLRVVASLISQGGVVGWHQGRMEFGPRALGSRSILADARDPEMRQKLNAAIKFRESFRPFAPIVTAEQVADYFDHPGASPYMTFVKKVKHGQLFPSVTHRDQTARLQTVHSQTNPRLWKLLHSFKDITGHPVMINTSFNVRGEPIVNSPEEAYLCFMNTAMDFLVIGNYLVERKRQAGPPAKKISYEAD